MFRPQGLMLFVVVTAASVLVLDHLTNWLNPIDEHPMESGFVVGIAKLRHGVPFYSDPSDLNGTIYHPGSHCFYYTVLRLCGLDASIIAQRVLGALCVLASACLFVKYGFRRLREIEPSSSIWVRLTLGAALTLFHLLFDTLAYPHPNGLIFLCFLLGVGIVFYPPNWMSTLWRWIALAGIVFCMSAVKQQGIFFGLILVWGLCWNLGDWRRFWLGTCFCAAALAAPVAWFYSLWGDAYWTWAFEIPRSHPINPEHFLNSDIALCVPVLAFLLMGRRIASLADGPGVARVPNGAWASLALLIPASLFFMAKVGSGFTTLGPAWDLLVLFTLPEIVHWLGEASQAKSSPLSERARILNALAVPFVLVLLALLGPILVSAGRSFTLRPDRWHDTWEVARQLPDASSNDLFISHAGIVALRYGVFLPNDHAIWEVVQANRPEFFDRFREELRAKRYSRIVVRPSHVSISPLVTEPLSEFYAPVPTFRRLVDLRPRVKSGSSD